MNIKKIILISAISLMAATHAKADIIAKFDEGAPKDRFTFTNQSDCAIKSGTIGLDISGSKAGLIFDVSAQGPGVEVFQLLEFVSGENLLTSKPIVQDGDTLITLPFTSLPSGGKISFTIDVDDTVQKRGITVSGSEILGAIVSLKTQAGEVTSNFGSNAIAVLNVNTCES